MPLCSHARDHMVRLVLSQVSYYPLEEGGSRIAIVFNGSPLFTGDAGSGESNIRQWIIENDWLEAIVALPDQLFYNTGISTYIWVLTNRKDERRRGKVQLIDARRFFVPMRKSLGNKRHKIGDPDDGEPDQIGEITRIHGNFQDNETWTLGVDGKEKTVAVSKVFDNEDFGFHKITVERPLRLNFQATVERLGRLDGESGFARLATSSKKDEAQRLAEIEAGEQRQQAIRDFLQDFAAEDEEHLYTNRETFRSALQQFGKQRSFVLAAPELKAVLGALGERDETADICTGAGGKPEADADLRDTESVPLKRDIEEYFKAEVLPHVPDAWIDHAKTKVGYEIPLNRHFYVYEPPRDLNEIETELRALETEIVRALADVTGTSTKEIAS